MGQSAISHQVRQRTGAAFGAALSPHLFRDCAATEIAISDPDHARNIALILGPATQATSEHHYNQAQALQAGRRYHATLETIRHSAGASSVPPA
jgi:integrase